LKIPLKSPRIIAYGLEYRLKIESMHCHISSKTALDLETIGGMYTPIRINGDKPEIMTGRMY